MIRRLIPQLLVPLAMIANLIAADPWLRAFTVGVGAVPLLGAAVLSVLVPAVSYRLGARLWLGALVDLAALVLYLLFVVLHDLSGFARIWAGLHHGPSQILTFALPLVSPRSLMVGPAVLIWIGGAVAGECLVRRWATLLPHAGLLTSFGLAYAATQRAASGDLSSIRLRETLLAGGLLVVLLLIRTAQAWVRQDESAESTRADGVLPTRGFTIGVATAATVAIGAALVVQANAFPKQATTPQRRPLVNSSNPLAPLQFIAGVRPPYDAKATAATLFDVNLNAAAPGYFGIANVDYYDGSGWSFDRTFRPSGGVLPADPDSSLTTGLAEVMQRFTIRSGALSSAPWMPTLDRAQRVTGAAVDIDPASGMIVPATPLPAGSSYTVESQVADRTFAELRTRTATPDTSTPASEVQVAPALRATLDTLISSFAAETGTPSQPALPFLAALRTTLVTDYSLSPPAQGSALGTRSPTVSPSGSPTPVDTGAAGQLAGGTGFADVIASVLGQQRSGTPEQFATLIALVARELGVPVRVVTGFRVEKDGSTLLPAGSYSVTASQAWTWAEVPIIGKGWLVLDATPSQFSDQSRDQDTGASSSPTPSSTPSQPLITQASGGGHAVASKANPNIATRTASSSGLLVAVLIAGAALVLAMLLVLLSRKPVRRVRRQRAPDPRTQLLGAWQESLDMLTESGLPELTALTSAEIAELTGAQFGPASREQATVLGHAANAVAYSAATVVEPREVTRAWATQRRLRRAVRTQLPVGQRVMAAVRYHHAKRVRAGAGPSSWAAEAAARTASETPNRRRYQGHRRR